MKRRRRRLQSAHKVCVVTITLLSLLKEKARENESEKREENKIYYSLLELKICIKYNKVAAGAVKRNNFHF